MDSQLNNQPTYDDEESEFLDQYTINQAKDIKDELVLFTTVIVILASAWGGMKTMQKIVKLATEITKSSTEDDQSNYRTLLKDKLPDLYHRILGVKNENDIINVLATLAAFITDKQHLTVTNGFALLAMMMATFGIYKRKMVIKQKFSSVYSGVRRIMKGTWERTKQRYGIIYNNLDKIWNVSDDNNPVTSEPKQNVTV